ncbi:hypothetical protein J8J14_11775 [Roseomonas sp. SSH11]|uniref:Uncharacterized protein n=1 Tax=Pararoseomonas baculiformis TaxID=2820812 RepID=A0ABS4AEP7_9PROT|nr:hypothetical protein [Pararoseomonas baculiformis]MBP0445456.1 hypothetical protein [Pararoseomonas baculiformis]
MNENEESEEERRLRLERQRVGPEEEVRKTVRRAEEKMETAEDQAIHPPGATDSR